MLVVEVNKKGGIERAPKEYKRKVIKTKQLNNIRDNRYYEKPSSKKRIQNQKAKYVQKIKDSEN